VYIVFWLCGTGISLILSKECVLLASLVLCMLNIIIDMCGFWDILSIWKSGSVAMPECIVILMSDLLCLE
jgi:hypothetical membrane protein